MHVMVFTTIKDSVSHILNDNITMIYYVNKQGRAHSTLLCREAIKWQQFFIEEDITRIVIHLPGVQSHLSDHLSKYFSLNHKWFLKTSVIWSIFIAWSILTIDLFATRLTGNMACSALQGASVHAQCLMLSTTVSG